MPLVFECIVIEKLGSEKFHRNIPRYSDPSRSFNETIAKLTF